MLSDLDPSERLLLLRFVCAFAWSDLSVQSQERQFIKKLVSQLRLSPDDAALVQGWLAEPPTAEEVDPENVPVRHRRLFLETTKRLIESDGVVDEHEAELYAALEELLS
jgi:uncharacterized membrane protein YebE (DUF533 family)